MRELLRCADELAREGRTADALAAYEGAARRYAREGAHLKAVAVYRHILNQDEARGEAREALVEGYQALGLVTEAVVQLKTLAQLCGRRGERAKRRDAYRRVLELDPEDEEANAAFAEEGGRR